MTCTPAKYASVGPKGDVRHGFRCTHVHTSSFETKKLRNEAMRKHREQQKPRP